MKNHESKKTILCVDDEENIRILVRTWLEEAGYIVLLACDGKEAMDILKIKSRMLWSWT